MSKKYKLINTGNTDQIVPVQHGSRKSGVLGFAGSVPGKISIPGLAKVSEGKNFVAVSEEVLRSIFGLYEMTKPGVFGPTATSITPDNVKRNSRLLDTGRVIVTDEHGKHILGVGGKAYQKNAMDNLKTENELMSDKLDTLRQVLVNDGYTEDQANAILSGNKAKVQEVLKEKEIGTRGKGHSIVTEKPSVPADFVGVAKEFFSDRETVTVFCGEDVVQEYKAKSMKNAVDKISKLSADAGIELTKDENGLPSFTDGEGRVVRLG